MINMKIMTEYKWLLSTNYQAHQTFYENFILSEIYRIFCKEQILKCPYQAKLIKHLPFLLSIVPLLIENCTINEQAPVKWSI